MMTRSELEAIANEPGFGGAAKALKKAGLWDEYAAAGPEREFTVYLDGTAHVAATVVVRARCQDEARRKGLSQAEGMWEIEEVSDVRDMTIDSMEGRG